MQAILAKVKSLSGPVALAVVMFTAISSYVGNSKQVEQNTKDIIKVQEKQEVMPTKAEIEDLKYEVRELRQEVVTWMDAHRK